MINKSITSFALPTLPGWFAKISFSLKLCIWENIYIYIYIDLALFLLKILLLFLIFIQVKKHVANKKFKSKKQATSNIIYFSFNHTFQQPPMENPSPRHQHQCHSLPGSQRFLKVLPFKNLESTSLKG